MPLANRGNSNKDNSSHSNPIQEGYMLDKKKEQTKEFRLQKPKYKMDEVILNERQKQDIQLAIGFYRFKEKLMEKWDMKARYPNNKGLCINLYGASGTGKTMSAHAIAESVGKEILIVNYAEIESKYVGETSKNLVRLFSYAEENDAVLLFDEADALLSKRVTNMTNSTDVSVNQTKSVLLNILNDFSGIVIFTTNFISNYDFAFMRRIPFQIKFSLPDMEQRKNLWQYYLSTKMPFSLNVDKMSKKYEGITGSDISNCVFLAALRAVMDEQEVVTEDYFDKTMENILQAKKENQAEEPQIISQREVSEEYAMEQLKGKHTNRFDK